MIHLGSMYGHILLVVWMQKISQNFMKRQWRINMYGDTSEKYITLNIAHFVIEWLIYEVKYLYEFNKIKYL